MTREEAREALSVLKIYDAPWLREAVDMAIEALHREEAEEKGWCHRIKPKEYLPSAEAVQGDGKMIPIELKRRYPHSRDEDITDAFMRGYQAHAEAVQGEWVHDGQNFKGGLDWCHCSECGYKTSTNGLSVYRFCPNCGARMNKGGDK